MGSGDDGGGKKGKPSKPFVGLTGGARNVKFMYGCICSDVPGVVLGAKHSRAPCPCPLVRCRAAFYHRLNARPANRGAVAHCLRRYYFMPILKGYRAMQLRAKAMRRTLKPKDPSRYANKPDTRRHVQTPAPTSTAASHILLPTSNCDLREKRAEVCACLALKETCLRPLVSSKIDRYKREREAMLDAQHAKAAPMIKTMLEAMGGLYNKAAQDLVTRGMVVPPQWVDELKGAPLSVHKSLMHLVVPPQRWQRECLTAAAWFGVWRNAIGGRSLRVPRLDNHRQARLRCIAVFLSCLFAPGCFEDMPKRCWLEMDKAIRKGLAERKALVAKAGGGAGGRAAAAAVGSDDPKVCFQGIETSPLAAASIGQVRGARRAWHVRMTCPSISPCTFHVPMGSTTGGDRC